MNKKAPPLPCFYASQGDMAYERYHASQKAKGTLYRERVFGELLFSALWVQSAAAAQAIEKPQGRYLSIHFLPPALWIPEQRETLVEASAAALSFFFSKSPSRLLVAGLGNRRLTADSLGPLAADGVEASAAVPEKARALFGLSSTSRVGVFVPDVFAETGMESAALIEAAARVFDADALLVFDALASSDRERLLTTFEMTDTGTVPGSGVKNSRHALSEASLGIPTVSVGVPTVMRMEEGFFLIPANLDAGIQTLAGVLAEATDRAFGVQSPHSFPFSIESLFSAQESEVRT